MALKVISERYLGDESARLLFLGEARAAARLRHSNVASVLHLGESAGNYFYAMEFVEGETLENLIPGGLSAYLDNPLKRAPCVPLSLPNWPIRRHRVFCSCGFGVLGPFAPGG